MSSSNLIDSLQSAIAKERNLALCLQNVVSTLAWTGLPEDRRQQIAEALERLSTAPTRRSKQLQEIIDRMNRSQ